MVRFLSILLGVFCAALVISSLFLKEPFHKEEKTVVSASYETIAILQQTKDTLNPDIHYQNVTHHLAKPYFQNTATGLVYRDDEALEHYYRSYTLSSDTAAADIGNLVLCILYSRTDRINFAYEHFLKIHNHELPYYEQEKGLLHYEYREVDSARYHLTRVVKLHPDWKDAQTALIKNEFYNRNYGALVDNLKSITLSYYPEYILARTYYYAFDLVPYYALRFNKYQGTAVEVVGAFLVALLWLFFLLKLNLFQRAESVPLFVVALISSITTFGCLLLYDFYEVYLNFDLTESIGNDLLYCILGIGFIEELAKLIPVLIVVGLFRDKLKEPYHFVLVAAVSALTFSTLENILYFKQYPGQVIYTRAMVSVIVHLFGTCVTAYGLFVVSFSRSRWNIGFGALCFLSAIVLHGLFDLVLINKQLELFHLFSYGLMFFAAYSLNRIINYALNTSPSFDSTVHPDVLGLRKLMIVGFTSILLFEFLVSSFFNGYYASVDVLIDSMLPFLLLLTFLVSSLSNFHFISGYRTGILQLVKEFKYKELLNTHLNVYPVQKKVLLDGVSFNTTVQRAVATSSDYIHAFLSNGQQYLGYKNILLKPYSLVSGKGKPTYSVNVYGVDESKSLDLEEKDLVLLTKAQVFSGETTELSEQSFLEKMGVWPVVITFVVGSLLFMFYMNYKSARQAYRWSFDFFEVKGIHQGYQNLLYALDKDSDFSEANLLAAKTNIYLKQYDVVLEQLQHVTPHTREEKRSVLYLQGYSLSKLKKEKEAIEVLSELVEAYPEGKDLDTAYRILGEYYLKKESYDKSLSAFNHIKQADGITQYHIALAMIGLKQYNESDKVLTRLIGSTRHPSADYLYNKGLCRLHLADTSSACQYLKQAADMEHTEATQLKGDWCYNYLSQEPQLITEE